MEQNVGDRTQGNNDIERISRRKGIRRLFRRLGGTARETLVDVGTVCSGKLKQQM